MKKIFVFLIMVCTFLLSGCSSLDRDVSLVRAGSHTFNHSETYVISTETELDEYVSNTYNNFNESVVEYDEDYFKTSALVIIEITKNSGSYKLTMSSVKIVDGSMIVKFKSSKPNIVTHDMAYWHIVVECTQEELLKFSSVQVYDNNNKVEVRE